MADELLQVHYDDRGIKALAGQAKGIPAMLARVAAPALNRTAAWTRTRMRREVASQCRLKARRADLLLRTDKANRTKLNAQVEIQNRRVPIGKFALSRSRKARVSVAFPSGVSLGYPRHFIATMPSGHRGVFVRARVVKPGVAVRRTEHVGRNRFGWYKYTSEKPIYEQRERLGTVMRMTFLVPLQVEGAAQLNREIESKMTWFLQRGI
jgi:hypothetical protein